jgi:hypothetical protein
MREADWAKVLGWPGYRVYRHEIEEQAKTLKLCKLQHFTGDKITGRK